MGSLTLWLSVILIGVFIVFLLFCTKENKILKQEKKKLEEEKKKLEEEKEKQENTKKKIKEVTKEKEEKLDKIKTGDDTSRFNASLDILSDVSKKRRTKPSK